MGFEEQEQPKERRVLRGANPWGRRATLSVCRSENEHAVTERRERTRKGELVPFYVAVYGTTRVYGGREEGGWYYNRERRLQCFRVWCFREALAKVRELMDEYQQPRWDIYSVLGDEDFHIYLARDFDDLPPQDSGPRSYE